MSFALTRMFLRSSRFTNRTLCSVPSIKQSPVQSTIIPPFFITDSTLREGEQFASCEFTSEDRTYLAKLLDKMGVDYIELVNPIASTKAFDDVKTICDLHLRAKVAVHTRCAIQDVQAAVDSGADAVNIYMATSEALVQHSHGKDIDKIIEIAQGVIDLALENNLEVRFSCEDAFRSNVDEIIKVYEAVVKVGAHRVGLADTVGVATPSQVADVTRRVRAAVGPDIGINFHTHNDTGCCIANALVAIENGATHIDTSILGIGERNGITPLGGMLSRLYVLDPDYMKSRFKLDMLGHLERYVASSVDITIPFNNYITGSSAFSHKAGVHSKAVMANPTSYEVINPQDFGVHRSIQFAHRLTGWNALSARAKDLGLVIGDELVKVATGMIKELADTEKLSLEQLDHVLLRLAQMPQVDASVYNMSADSDTSSDLDDVVAQARASVLVFQKAAAAHAIKTMPRIEAQERLTKVAVLKGHLFDTNLMNRIMDHCVESPCDFKVLAMDIPNDNAKLSTARIRFWGQEAAELDNVMATLLTIQQEAAYTSAHCVLSWEDGPSPELGCGGEKLE
eukprot:m.187352 g.187352  ORF g.187352 m.187352 type:complete len:567 (+) comp32301_c2_seq5:262-1962(+)